jgi:penicillin G amidase
MAMPAREREEESAGEPRRRPPPPRRGRKRLRRVLRGFAALLALLAVVLVAGGLWLRGRLHASLPQLRGERSVPGLTAPVMVERDALGIPSIRAANRLDAARALGFLHAQERFFEMDLLLRRRAAGEVSELMGPSALGWDRNQRRNRFRALARRCLARLPAEQRALVTAYTRGVNAGLAALGGKPFEYVVLRVEPQPWRPEDTLLASFTMFLELQGATREYEEALALMRDTLPPTLFAFLAPMGTEWDAPLTGGAVPPPPVPGPAVLNLQSHRRPDERLAALGRWERNAPGAESEVAPTARGGAQRRDALAQALAGSNGWAVSGRRTADGHALLANDIHFGMEVPNFWYRAAFSWRDAAGRERYVSGATLPGTPLLIVGSNRHVAWGFTSSLVDASDIVLLDVDPRAPDTYRTPAGPRRFERYREVIHARGARDETIEVPWTIWGPVLEPDRLGHARALSWVAHEAEAVDLGLVGMETAANVGEALAVAHRSGAPAQNLVVADDAGHIAWTLLGRLPRRAGFDGRLPASWADGRRRWDGLLAPAEVPQVVDPPAGVVWSANNRAVGGEDLARLGDGGYRLGARARQIRDRLLALERPTARDMLALQLDDRALFLERWQKLLLQALTPQALDVDPRRREFRRLVENWGGRAAVDSAGYRLVRAFRGWLAQQLFEPFLAPCRAVDPQFVFAAADQYESALWRLVTEQPPHLLNPRFRSWPEAFLATVDALIAHYEGLHDGVPLAGRTWGQINVTAIRHVMSEHLPFAGRYLDMPPQSLPGDLDMPRVQSPDFGATLRMVVSPGHEEQGYFQMPVGQSGHPLSPHYADSHAAWAKGTPTPFLPGPPVDVLTLRPAEPSRRDRPRG